MKYIITGGAGFIGSHLAEKLTKNKKNKIIILDNLSTGRISNIKHLKNKIKFVKCDLSKKGKWQIFFKNVKCVFHLAALADIVPSINDPEKYFRSNVLSTLNVLQVCRRYSVKKIVYSASSSCYGIPNKYPTDENQKINCQYPYALTKYLGEQLCMHWGKLFNINSISLRFFNVYGTRSRTSSTYGAMFGVFLAQKIAKIPYTVVGDGTQKRDFTYVSDVVDAIVKVAKSSLRNQIMNIGSGKVVSVNKIIKILKGKKVHIPNRPGEPKCTFADIRKARKLLNWSPKIRIEKGIELLLQNLEYWRTAPLWTPKKIKVATRDWFKYISNYA